MKLIDLEKIHEGKFLSYYIATYINDLGHTKKYEFTSRNNSLTKESFGGGVPQGVGMVTFSKDGNKILLEREFRLACNNWVYNFPGGLSDNNELPEETAKRELKEETGLDLVKVEVVLKPSYASPATSDELMQIVICRCDGEIKDSCFEDEEIITRWFNKDEVKKLLDEGALMSVRTQMFLYMWITNNKLSF